MREGQGERVLARFVAHEAGQARAAEPWRRLGFEFMSRSRTPALRRRDAELTRKLHAETVPVVQQLIDGGVVAKGLDPGAVAGHGAPGPGGAGRTGRAGQEKPVIAGRELRLALHFRLSTSRCSPG